MKLVIADNIEEAKKNIIYHWEEGFGYFFMKGVAQLEIE